MREQRERRHLARAHAETRAHGDIYPGQRAKDDETRKRDRTVPGDQSFKGRYLAHLRRSGANDTVVIEMQLGELSVRVLHRDADRALGGAGCAADFRNCIFEAFRLDEPPPEPIGH